ncbi:hypothetical protein ACWT_4138 [Actinoplanes sp. SE50]|nr:hypothetical protein ACPL_4267 [Actinoplanes sp. SE50/110]ATO83553.1 hypothetical protein ACWT_4138 [Actinoplanes sp. SE50]SLM00960.1 hypothetical protein ACSP50_4193 [Actinoplanes sp. SE50/110]
MRRVSNCWSSDQAEIEPGLLEADIPLPLALVVATHEGETLLVLNRS